MTRPLLEPKHIHELLLKDYTWDDIGRKLAKEHGRRLAYTGRAVITAYKRARRIDALREELARQLRAP